MTAIDSLAPAIAPVRHESDLPVLRRHVRRLGRGQGLSHVQIEALATAVSEIARNVLDHAAGGDATVTACREPARHGVVVVLRDAGAGIPDVARALQDGYTSRGGLGLGLAAAQRMVDEFSIQTEPGAGTVVTLAQWVRDPRDA